MSYAGRKNNNEKSNGLGLAIVKKIADVNNLNIEYHAEEGVHSFALRPARF